MTHVLCCSAVQFLKFPELTFPQARLD
jgi:hypothetical protein